MDTYLGKWTHTWDSGRIHGTMDTYMGQWIHPWGSGHLHETVAFVPGVLAISTHYSIAKND